MSDARRTRVYRALFSLYPRQFRQEYGPDMALLFEDQLRDEPAARVWVRAVIDLAITVPTQHLEAHMNRPPNPAIPAVFTALSVAGIFLTMVSGVRGGMTGIGLAIALIFGALAVAAWRRTRAVTGPGLAEHWWKFVAVGGGVFTATVVLINVFDDLGDGWWLPMMITFAASIMVGLTGLILGIARLGSRRPPATA